MLTRRSLLFAAPALGAASQVAAQGPKNIVILSANGMTCCEVAMANLNRGRDTLDAVNACFNVNELDPEDSSVGFGGLPNEEGVVELMAKLAKFDINFYALRKDGVYAEAGLWSGGRAPGGGFTSPKFADGGGKSRSKAQRARRRATNIEGTLKSVAAGAPFCAITLKECACLYERK